MINTVLFDLDGTLLPMDLDGFVKIYFDSLGKKFAQLGYDYKVILNGVIAGTKMMVKNDGATTNEEVFWQSFKEVTGISKEDCEEDFTSFYHNEFTKLARYTKQNKYMCEAVNELASKGYRLLLTTNPMFPKMAVEERVRWAGVDSNVFTMMTSYEYCHYTKPNVNYYKEVVEKEKLVLEECMMVGNDSLEDGVIETLGIPLYLITDYLIHRNDEPLKSKWHSNSEQFLQFVKELPNLKEC